MVDMARKEIIPAVAKFAADTASSVAVKKSVASNAACAYETRLVTELSKLIDAMDEATTELEGAIDELKGIESIITAAEFVRDTLLPTMDKLLFGV